jgi:hypothetical protein
LKSDANIIFFFLVAGKITKDIAHFDVALFKRLNISPKILKKFNVKFQLFYC